MPKEPWPGRRMGVSMEVWRWSEDGERCTDLLEDIVLLVLLFRHGCCPAVPVPSLRMIVYVDRVQE